MTYTITYLTIKKYGYGGVIATQNSKSISYYDNNTIIIDKNYIINVDNIIELSIHKINHVL